MPVLKTVRDACKPHPMALNYAMAEQVENLLDVIKEEGDGSEFFRKNYLTRGMNSLLQTGLRRLAGKSDQAVCHLVQAMGGGKTHLMIALGLLAGNDDLRSQEVPELAEEAPFANARVVALTGRIQYKEYIWGEIASQLGKKEAFSDYWKDGADAPDQVAWKQLIGDEPTLILLDELAPYFDYAVTKKVGDGNLAQVATYALSTLLSAALELPRCFVVVSDLSGSYREASQDLGRAIDNFRQEANRQSKKITPVDLGSDEIYQILKKRLFQELPPESEVERIADAYAQAISEAEKAKVIAKSTEQIASEIRRSYPFHPSVKDVIALFRNNENYRQTRGLMQFISKMIRSVWNRGPNDVYLMGVQHLNMNDAEVREEVVSICDLQNAIAHDIAANQEAVAEVVDSSLNSDAASQIATLVMVSSMSTAVDAVKGLTKQQVLEYLTAPERPAIEFDQAFDAVRKGAWYLHRNSNDAFYFSNVENLTKRLEMEAVRAPQNKIDIEMRRRLGEIFKPSNRNAYQECQALPVIEQLTLKGPRVLLVLAPDSKKPPAEAVRFYENVVEKNNVLIVTGDRSGLADIEDYTRRIYAAVRVQDDLPADHPQKRELDEKKESAEYDFNSAVINTFNRLYYPTRRGLTSATVDMTFEANSFRAEEQIEKTLASTAVSKLYLNIEEQAAALMDRAEMMLWSNQKRLPWRDVQMNALTNPRWVWLPAKGLDALRKVAESQGRWRSTDDGYIEKGPFEQPKTKVDILEREHDDATGTANLVVTAVYPKEGAVIHYAETVEVDEHSPVLDSSEMTTDKTRLYFLAVDPSNRHELGEPTAWSNKLTLAYQPNAAVNGRRTVELQVKPRGQIRYTLNGANPKDGDLYTQPIEIGEGEITLYVYAEDQDVSTQRNFYIPPVTPDEGLVIKPDRPATLKYVLSAKDTADSFKLINRVREKQARVKIRSIEVGQGASSVSTRVGADIEVTADGLENLVKVMREIVSNDMADVKISTQSIEFQMGQDLESFLQDWDLKVNQENVDQ